MIYLYVFNISGIRSISEVATLMSHLSEERKERISKLRFNKDKLHCMFAEVILKYALKEQFEINEVVIEKNAYGKPRLADYEDIHFNLSHSGDWVVCGVGDCNLGIDVERILEIEREIADEFFAKEEIDYLGTIPENEWLNAFYTIWTLKECYTKNVGEGMSIPLDSFAIIPQNGLGDLYICGEKREGFSFRTQNLDESHKMAVCISGEGNSAETEFKILSLKELEIL